VFKLVSRVCMKVALYGKLYSAEGAWKRKCLFIFNDNLSSDIFPVSTRGVCVAQFRCN